MTRGRGPKRSARYASKGTSQVSKRTKRVKVNWIATLPQWYFASIGLMKIVQPYCKLAIMAMQMTPAKSCTHGFDDVLDRGGTMFAVVPAGGKWGLPSEGFEGMKPPREYYCQSYSEAKETPTGRSGFLEMKGFSDKTTVRLMRRRFALWPATPRTSVSARSGRCRLRLPPVA